MKFLLLPHLPSPDKPDAVQVRELVDLAVLAEEWGFDGYAVGERHDRPAVSSSPPVILANVAARTSRIKLFTAVTTLGYLDPLRAFEDYSTLDILSGGRLELIIGKGAYPRSSRLFGVTHERQWDLLRENYALFRRLWADDDVTWPARSLEHAEALPRPERPGLRVWHGSATSLESAEFAARHGDPLFSSNGTGPPGPFAALIDHYRQRFAAYGHDPAKALVGAGTAGYFGHRDARTAVAKYRPVFEARLKVNKRYDRGSIRYDTVEDWIAGSSVLVGSPQQIIEKVAEQHRLFGHEVMHIHVDGEILAREDYLATLELFFTEIAPVLRKELPSRSPADW